MRSYPRCNLCEDYETFDKKGIVLREGRIVDGMMPIASVLPVSSNDLISLAGKYIYQKHNKTGSITLLLFVYFLFFQ